MEESIVLGKEFIDAKQIYRGKNSVVYRANYQGRPVIAKTVSRIHSSQKRAASLLHEKHIIKKLKHISNVVKILEVKETDQQTIAVY